MSLRLLHVSDSHLYSDCSMKLKGIVPCDSFAAVLADARQRYPEIDVLIMGGDMAQDEAADTYRQLVSMLPDWPVPVMLSPGNHASMENIASVLVPALEARHGYTQVLQAGNWQVLTINTHKDGQVPGYVTPAELARLDGLLSASAGMHTLIALHHPPLLVGSRWMDNIGLVNASDLWGVVRRHAHVRAMLCGHIHQAFDSEYAGVRVLGSPSTSVQFTPGKDDFELDGISPGYRWLQLGDDGSVDTVVHRIDGFVPPDLHDTIPY